MLLKASSSRQQVWQRDWSNHHGHLHHQNLEWIAADSAITFDMLLPGFYDMPIQTLMIMNSESTTGGDTFISSLQGLTNVSPGRFKP